VLTADGSLHAFGGAVGKTPPVTSDNRPEWQKLRVATGGGGYLVGHWGKVSASASVHPNWSGYADWNGWDIQRDVRLFTADATPQPQPMSAAAAALVTAAEAPHGGVTLDGLGGLHPFGEVPINTHGSPYWVGWNIARSTQVRDDGSGGWTLDGYGGIHPWGTAPAARSTVYWQGWDIARAFVVTSVDSNHLADGRQGYVLDGFGGVHPWGGAPNIGGPPYLAGFDVYRGLAIHTAANGTPDGGWAMDAVGHTYAFGNATALGDVSTFAGRPLYMKMHASANGWYAVAAFGKVLGFGTGYMQADWAGWADYGAWNIISDVALINPVDPGSLGQPLSAPAAQSFVSAVGARYLLRAPLYRQSHTLDCEAATLQIVLAARGTLISQDAELAYWGADLRPAVKDAAGNILHWGDPYVTFVGNVNASEWNATGYGIYYPPLVRLATALGHNAIGKERWSVSALFDLVAEGYPAAVEGTFNMESAAPRDYTAWDGRTVQYTLNNHVFALVGIDFGAQTVIINDPFTATQKVFTWAAFIRSFSYIDNMATVVS
jgi:Peptidase_C39 like family